jgi:hypothetical protein
VALILTFLSRCPDHNQCAIRVKINKVRSNTKEIHPSQQLSSSSSLSEPEIARSTTGAEDLLKPTARGGLDAFPFPLAGGAFFPGRSSVVVSLDFFSAALSSSDAGVIGRFFVL